MEPIFRFIMKIVVQSLAQTVIVLSLVLCLSPLTELWAQAALKKASFVPQWIPQARFAGYMVALDKGFYGEAGLDPTLMKGGPGKPPFEAIESGDATFCTDWLSNGIEKRASGLGIVKLCQVSQRSALLLAAKKKSGIERPQDLNGKTVGLRAGQFYSSTRRFLSEVWA